MHARWTVPPFALLLTCPLVAQSTAVLGKDDGAYARALYRSGFADLAEKLCTTIEGSGKIAPTEAAGLKALHLDLRLDLARQEADLAKRKELIKSVLVDKEEFVKNYPGTKETEEVQNSLPDVYRVLGETITALVQKETNIAEVAKLQGEGHEIYTRAEEALRGRIELLEPDHEDPAKEAQYIAARYNLPRTQYFHSMLYPDGEWKRKDLLEKAVEGLQLFGLDYSDRDLNYEGMIYMGLADHALGKTEDALQDFDGAIELGTFYEKDAKGVYQMAPMAADIVSSAVLQKMLVQIEMKDFAGAIATAKNFYDTTPDPEQSRQGLAVLAARADAEIAAGDTKAAGETAERLVKADERGSWGARGREIQGQLLNSGSGPVDASNVLKIAQSLWSRGDFENAIRVCHKAIAAARGAPKEADLATDAYILIGAIYSARRWNHEASVAYDVVGDRYPKAERAPEAVYQSMQTYLRLNAEEKRPYYRKRVEERMKILATRYSNHPLAAGVQVAEGQQFESDGDFLKAAEVYLKVTPGSSSYQQAQFRAGNAYFLQARKLLQEKKADAAKQYVTQAETLLMKARTEFDALLKGTLDLEAQARLENLAFQSRAALAQLYLLPGVDRLNDVVPVLADVEEKFGNDESRIADAWGLRIQALQKQGKFEEAVSLLDSLVKKNPDSRAIGPAAGLVARALDQRAIDLRDKESKPADADAMQKRAAKYYSMSGRAILKSGVGRGTQVEDLAGRLYTLGLYFNGVPEDQQTFAGWTKQKTRDSDLWQQAADLFDAALKVSPNYKSTILLGRVRGFLGHYAAAADVYGELFDSEPFYDRVSAKFDSTLRKNKPELMNAYLEWGVSSHLAGAEANDQDRLLLARGILDALCTPQGLPANTKPWWYAKYHQIKCFVDLGKYEDAQFLMNETVRKSSDLGGGDADLKTAFATLKDELDKKTFPQPK
jgi:tetratricopeptide (TPR) repeat protein